MAKQRITQHKRFMPYGTQLNPALYAFYWEVMVLQDSYGRYVTIGTKLRYLKGWASFMLKTLFAMQCIE